MEAFFEGSEAIYPGAEERFYSQRVIIRETQGSNADTTKGSFVASAWNIANTTDEGTAALASNLSALGLQNLHRPVVIEEVASGSRATTDVYDLTLTAGNDVLTVTTGAVGSTADGAALLKLKEALDDGAVDLKGFSFTFVNAAGEALYETASFTLDDTSSVVRSASPTWRDNNQTNLCTHPILRIPADQDIANVHISRDDMTDFKIKGGANQQLRASVQGDVAANFAALTTTDVETTVLEPSSIDWVDELDPAVAVGYDAVNQRLSFVVDRTVLGSGTKQTSHSFTCLWFCQSDRHKQPWSDQCG